MTLRLLLRTGALLVSLAVSSAAVFAFMAVLPGDPARVALGVNASDAAVAAMRTQYGLDRPLLTPVSYTHLDVYKRQQKTRPRLGSVASTWAVTASWTSTGESVRAAYAARRTTAGAVTTSILKRSPTFGTVRSPATSPDGFRLYRARVVRHAECGRTVLDFAASAGHGRRGGAGRLRRPDVLIDGRSTMAVQTRRLAAAAIVAARMDWVAW